jgi:hypothetical protein
MYKAIGPCVIVKVVKTKSKLDLSQMNTTAVNQETVAIVESIGTKCTSGILPGHEVLFRPAMQPLVIEENDDYDLLIVPETAIAYIKNFEEPGE